MPYYGSDPMAYLEGRLGRYASDPFAYLRTRRGPPSPVQGGGVPVGFVGLLDLDGSPLTDLDGSPLYEAA